MTLATPLAFALAAIIAGSGVIGGVIGWWMAKQGERLLAQRDYDRLFGER